MCGIIGFTGKVNNAKDIAISGLKKLEYRGYDSAGIAICNNGIVNLYKKEGKISNLEEELKNKDLKASTAMAHTRWATHGKASSQNAHPHKFGKVTLVHNGIIENYLEIKKFLLDQGFDFNSDTDTEVACAYINYMYEKFHDPIKSIFKACEKFRGSYAFGIIFDEEIDTIYSIRKDSPLIVGISNDGNFMASDISAIVEFTKNYILLSENVVAKIAKNKVELYDNNLNTLDYKTKTVDWDTESYQNNKYEHFMLKEINEQPKVISDIFKRYKNGTLFDKNLNLSKYSNIHIIACGSAMHAGLIGKFLIEKYLSIPVKVEVASEYRYNNQLITDSTLVIIISQSGETADSLAALRIAKQKNADTLAIVNVVGSTIAREASKTIYTNAGPEIAVATTKGYTSQIAVLALLTMEFMKEKGILSKDLEESISNDFEKSDTILSNIISMDNEFLNIAKNIYKKENIFFIGRGMDFSICMEGSLKLKEISYIHSEAYPAGELKHGTISLIEDGTPVIAIATEDNIYEKTVSNVKETKARGSFVIFITTKEDFSCTDFSDIVLRLPSTSDFFKSFILATSLQLISYHTAKLRGCNIDKPKNLAKSVTVE